MYSFVLGLIPLLLITPSLVLAEPRRSERCYTQYGTESPSTVSTTTTTVRKQVTKTVIRNTHPHITVTPTTHITRTVIKTKTDTEMAPQETDTATETETTTVTTTKTLAEATEHTTSTETTTSTSTYQGVSTVATPAGFTPVLDSLPNSVKRKRELDSRGGSLAARRSEKPRPLALDFAGKRYPTKITCVDFVYHTTTTRSIRSRTGTVTKTAKTSTIKEKTTESTTVTTTITTPDASTTTTTTATDTSTVTESPTTTVTDVTTTTETAVIATSTIQAACNGDGSRNIAGGANGKGFIFASGLSGSHYMQSAAPSADDCCEQCFAIGNTCVQAIYSVLYGTNHECQLDIVPSPQTASTCLGTSSGFGVDQGIFGSAGPQNSINYICPGST